MAAAVAAAKKVALISVAIFNSSQMPSLSALTRGKGKVSIAKLGCYLGWLTPLNERLLHAGLRPPPPDVPSLGGHDHAGCLRPKRRLRSSLVAEVCAVGPRASEGS